MDQLTLTSEQELFIMTCTSKIAHLSEDNKCAIVSYPRTGTQSIGPQYGGLVIAIRILLRDLQKLKLDFTLFGNTKRITSGLAPSGIEFGSYNDVIPNSIKSNYVILYIDDWISDLEMIELIDRFSHKKCLYITKQKFE